MNRSTILKIQGAYLSDSRTAVLKESGGSEIHLAYIANCGWCIELKLEKCSPRFVRKGSLLPPYFDNCSPLEMRSSKLDTVIYSSEGEIVFANDGGAFCMTRSGELVLESCTIPFSWEDGEEPRATFYYPRPDKTILGLPGCPGDVNRNGRRHTYSAAYTPVAPVIFHLSPSGGSWLGLLFDIKREMALDLGEELQDSVQAVFYEENPRLIIAASATLAEASAHLCSLYPPLPPLKPQTLGYHQIFDHSLPRLKTMAAVHASGVACDGVHVATVSEAESQKIKVVRSKIPGKTTVPIGEIEEVGITGIVLHTPRRSEWITLRETIDSLINYSVSGVYMQGALTPGVLGHTPEDLAVRFYQLAAFLPFFAGLTGVEGREKSPSSYSERANNLIRRATNLRYSLAREWYSNFERCAREQRPLIQPTVEPDGTLVRDQFLLFDKLLVAPVVERDQKHRQVYLPGGEWFPFGDSNNPLDGDTWLLLPVDERAIPLFVRAGSIIVRNVPHLTIEDSLQSEEGYEIYADRYGNGLGYWFEDASPPERYILSSCHYSQEIMRLPVEESPLLPHQANDEI